MIKVSVRMEHDHSQTRSCIPWTDAHTQNLGKFKKQLEREGHLEEAAGYDFSPQTYYLPQEFGLWREAFRASQPTDGTRGPALWIMKPIGRCQGQGIFLVSKPAQVAAWGDAGGQRFGSSSTCSDSSNEAVCACVTRQLFAEKTGAKRT